MVCSSTFLSTAHRTVWVTHHTIEFPHRRPNCLTDGPIFNVFTILTVWNFAYILKHLNTSKNVGLIEAYYHPTTHINR